MTTTITQILLATACATMLSVLVNAQQTVHTITIDMGNPAAGVDLSELNTAKKGDQYRVVIKDVNLNLYRVTVNGSDSSTAKAVTFPSFGDFAIDPITKLVGGVGQVVTKAKANGQESSNAYMVDSKTAIGDTLNAHSETIAALSGKILSLKTDIDNFLMNVQLRELDLKCKDEHRLWPIVRASAIDKVSKLRGTAQQLQKEIAKEQGAYVKYVTKDDVKQAIADDEKLKDMSGKVASGYSTLTTGIVGALVSVDANTSSALLEQLQFLELNKTHTYLSQAFQYKGGDGKLTVSVVPRKEEYNLQTYNSTFKFPLNKPRYVGVSASFYGAKLYNDAISSVADTSGKYKLVQEDVTRFEIGAAALFTYGTKLSNSRSVGIQGVIGPGISVTETVRPRLLLGGGLSFGKENMLMVNFGGIVGFVDRRSAAYADDGPYYGETGKPTVVKLDGSLFLSIGYLFAL